MGYVCLNMAQFYQILATTTNLVSLELSCLSSFNARFDSLPSLSLIHIPCRC